jgi:hypothetical protein
MQATLELLLEEDYYALPMVNKFTTNKTMCAYLRRDGTIPRTATIGPMLLARRQQPIYLIGKDAFRAQLYEIWQSKTEKLFFKELGMSAEQNSPDMFYLMDAKDNKVMIIRKAKNNTVEVIINNVDTTTIEITENTTNEEIMSSILRFFSVHTKTDWTREQAIKAPVTFLYHLK